MGPAGFEPNSQLKVDTGLRLCQLETYFTTVQKEKLPTWHFTRCWAWQFNLLKFLKSYRNWNTQEMYWPWRRFQKVCKDSSHTTYLFYLTAQSEYLNPQEIWNHLWEHRKRGPAPSPEVLVPLVKEDGGGEDWLLLLYIFFHFRSYPRSFEIDNVNDKKLCLGSLL